jgi:hypothetical protein
MTSSIQSSVSANVLVQLYFQTLRRLGLFERFAKVPFKLQQRSTGHRPEARCLSILASLAQGCRNLTDWNLPLRKDSLTLHWLQADCAPHPSTLSRSLKAVDQTTVRAIRSILSDLSDQAWSFLPDQNSRVMLDIDNKGIRAEGRTYEGATKGYMPDGDIAQGYRLHLLSIDNQWPMEAELTGANAPAVPSAMVLVKRLMSRLTDTRRQAVVIRGDSAHGTVWFVKFLNRYPCGYLLKGNNNQTAIKLWEQKQGVCVISFPRPGGPDLQAIDCGAMRLDGFHHWHDSKGKEHRSNVHAHVPRVVIYRQDPSRLKPDKQPEYFCLITTLDAAQYPPRELLELYDKRAGDVENIFCQLDQAFNITHMRCRNLPGNLVFMLLGLIASTLTQIVRQEAIQHQAPIPPGLKETLDAAKESGIRLEYGQQIGYDMLRGTETHYTATFARLLNLSYQHRFRYAA